jgi:hypothetical protein
VPRWRVGIGADDAIIAGSIGTACKRASGDVCHRIGQNSEGLPGRVESKQGGVSICWRNRKGLRREMPRRRDRCTSNDAGACTDRHGPRRAAISTYGSAIPTVHQTCS